MGNRRLYKIERLHALDTRGSERLKVTALNLLHPTASPPFSKSWVFPYYDTVSLGERVRVRGVEPFTLYIAACSQVRRFGRLTNSPACQELPLIPRRRHPSSLPVPSTGQACRSLRHCRERIYAFPTRNFGGPRKRDFADSTCVRPFLSNPGKMTVSAVPNRQASA